MNSLLRPRPSSRIRRSAGPGRLARRGPGFTTATLWAAVSLLSGSACQFDAGAIPETFLTGTLTADRDLGLVADGVDGAEVVARLHSNANDPVEGVEVTFAVEGSAVLATPTSAITDASGIARARLTSTAQGAKTVRASASLGDTTVDLPQTITVLFVGPDANPVTLRSGAIWPLSGTPSSTAVADFDGDGRADLLVAGRSGKVSLARADSNGGLLQRQDVRIDPARDVPPDLRGLALLDLDGDIHPDALVTEVGPGAQATFWRVFGGGSGVYIGAPGVEDCAYPLAIAAGQLDMATPGAEVVLACTEGGSLMVIEGLAPDRQGERTSYAVGGAPVAVAIGDVDGDGDGDVVVVDNAADRLLWLRGDGTGALTHGGTFAVPAEVRDVSLGQLDGDGGLEVLVVGRLQARVLSLGASSVDPAPLGSFTLAGGTAGALADVDGDGLADPLLADGSASLLGVHHTKAGMTFAEPIELETGVQPVTVGYGDFNGDGFIDLISANRQNATASLFLGGVAAQ